MIAVRFASPDPTVRSAAYQAAALKQEPVLLGALLTRVGSNLEPDARLRSTLIQTIAFLGGKEQIPVLASFLDDRDARCRSTAIEALASLRDLNAYGYIGKALGDPDHRVQLAAAKALQDIGALNAVAIAKRMPESEKYWIRDAAAHLLTTNPTLEGLPLMESALSDSYEPVLLKAKRGLLRLVQEGVEEARPALEKGAGIKDGEDPLDFLQLETRPATTTTDILSSPDVEARRKAARQMAESWLAGDGHLPLLMARLGVEEDATVICSLLTALGQTKNAITVARLAEFAQHSDPAVRAAAIDACALIGTDQALNVAIPQLKDSSPSVIARAILALRQYPIVDLGPPMEWLANHQDPEHRKTAVQVAGVLNDNRYRNLVQRLSTDTDPAIAALAIETVEHVAFARGPAPQRRIRLRRPARYLRLPAELRT